MQAGVDLRNKEAASSTLLGDSVPGQHVERDTDRPRPQTHLLSFQSHFPLSTYQEPILLIQAYQQPFQIIRRAGAHTRVSAYGDLFPLAPLS